MKFIHKIILDINRFIKKDFLKKDLSVKSIQIIDTWFEIDAANHAIQLYSTKKIIDLNNYQEIKNYLDSINPEDYSNINNYNFYYDFIMENFYDFVEKNPQLKINKDDYFLKSAENVYKHVLKNRNLLSNDEKEQFRKIMFRNINYKCKYAVHILKDRLVDYEKELLKMDFLDNDKINIYFNQVLISLINYHHDLNERTKKFEKIYRESKLYRKLIHDRIKRNRYSSLKIIHRSDILDDLALKHPDMLEYYLDHSYFDSGKPVGYTESLKGFINRINKNPKAIYAFYGVTRARNLLLPENKEVRETLMTDPETFTKFLMNSIYRTPLESIDEYFPNYQKVISKLKDITMIRDFFSFLQKKIFKNNYDLDFKKDHKSFAFLKEYIYNNYPELIERISKNAVYSYYVARIIGSPFKEAEPTIFSDKGVRFSYLTFLKNDLGRDLVPNYNDYDFSILDEENEEQDEIGF